MTARRQPNEIVVTAAHGGIGTAAVPVGGGAAVVHQLLKVWGAQPPCRLRLLGLGPDPRLPGVHYEAIPIEWPAGLGPLDLVRLNEWEYARLCRQFEAGVTRRILELDRRGLVVVANDLSEGPDFAALQAAGVPVVTLWHVDVVDYFARFYLGGLPPARLTAAHRWLGAGARLLPDVLRLVFDKQAAAMRCSARQVVPSSPMRSIIEGCYPGTAERVSVVPWGSWSTAPDPAAVAAETDSLRREYELRPDETLLVTLSRLSPEKGLERLLTALHLGQERGELPPRLRCWIAGEAAFMQGERYRRRLQQLADRLHRCRVDFIGYAGGARKHAVWQLADLYVFPSRHESYGLTLAEALAAGLPVVTTNHYSAPDLVPPEVGVVVPNRPESAVAPALWAAIRDLLADDDRRAALAFAAREQGHRLRFEAAAQRVLEICGEVLPSA